jgi:hypothetical protein
VGNREADSNYDIKADSEGLVGLSISQLLSCAPIHPQPGLFSTYQIIFYRWGKIGSECPHILIMSSPLVDFGVSYVFAIYIYIYMYLKFSALLAKVKEEAKMYKAFETYCPYFVVFSNLLT